MILLFDIDGTLVSAGGVGRRALALAFDQVLGVTGAMDGIRLDGNTDLAILDEAFEVHVGRRATKNETDTIFDAYFTNLESLLDDETYRVFEGADELSKAAHAAGYQVGLATGNMERGGRIKLRFGGLSQRFEFGGFGSDAKIRADLVRVGADRGQARFRERHGREAVAEEIFVLGDTERDVEAARAANTTSVGVLAGSQMQDRLLAAKPDVVATSLLDPDLWSMLKLA